MSGFELAATGQTLSVIIPIIAAVLVIAGVAAILIPRLRRRKADAAPVVERPAIEQNEVIEAEIVDQPQITQERPDEDRPV